MDAVGTAEQPNHPWFFLRLWHATVNMLVLTKNSLGSKKKTQPNQVGCSTEASNNTGTWNEHLVNMIAERPTGVDVAPSAEVSDPDHKTQKPCLRVRPFNHLSLHRSQRSTAQGQRDTVQTQQSTTQARRTALPVQRSRLNTMMPIDPNRHEPVPRAPRGLKVFRKSQSLVVKIDGRTKGVEAKTNVYEVFCCPEYPNFPGPAPSCWRRITVINGSSSTKDIYDLSVTIPMKKLRLYCSTVAMVCKSYILTMHIYVIYISYVYICNLFSPIPIIL